jgi:hypothetical protein
MRPAIPPPIRMNIPIWRSSRLIARFTGASQSRDPARCRPGRASQASAKSHDVTVVLAALHHLAGSLDDRASVGEVAEDSAHIRLTGLRAGGMTAS